MNFELDILHAIQSLRSDTLDTIMLALTKLGDIGILWIAIALLLLVVPAVGKETREHLKERRIAGVMILLSLVLNLLLANVLLKNLVGRIRPYAVDTSVVPLITCSDYSFPSGHTAASFASAMAIFFYRKKLGLISFVVASIIAFTRMYLFVHFPTDILGGMIVGVIAAVIVNKWVKPYVEKNWKRKHS